MRAFTYGLSLSEKPAQWSIKAKIKKIEEARLIKWTHRCLIHKKGASISGEEDKVFKNKKKIIHLTFRRTPYIIDYDEDEDDDDDESQHTYTNKKIKKEANSKSHPELIYYLPLEEQK